MKLRKLESGFISKFNDSKELKIWFMSTENNTLEKFLKDIEKSLSSKEQGDILISIKESNFNLERVIQKLLNKKILKLGNHD